MKTLISSLALFLLIVTSSFTIDAQQKLNEQNAECFNYFRAHRQNKGVAMSWSVSTSNVVEFVVEKSYDDYYYEPSGSVPYTGGNSYKFVDNNVYPGYIYVRVTAVKSDGTTECSPVQRVRIVQRN